MALERGRECAREIAALLGAHTPTSYATDAYEPNEEQLRLRRAESPVADYGTSSIEDGEILFGRKTDFPIRSQAPLQLYTDQQ